MTLGLALFYVGAVLFLNGLWLLNQISDRDIFIIDVFVGFITGAVALDAAFAADADLGGVRTSAFTLLFTFTYLWVSYNRYSGADGRGLGWYSLFVAISAVPIAYVTLTGFGGSEGVLWFAGCWAYWAVLWFMYFLLLAVKVPILKLTGWATLICGIVTGWIPGMLLLYDKISA